MKLKAKILVGMLALLASATVVMPSAGAVRGRRQSTTTRAGASVRPVDAGRARAGRRVARTTQHDLTNDAALTCIRRLAELTPQDEDDLDQKTTTIWHILIWRNKWHVIRCLLGTDGRNLFAKEVVDAFRQNFACCINRRTGNVASGTPLSIAERMGTVAQLKSCIPGDLPADLARRLPPVLNTFRR